MIQDTYDYEKVVVERREGFFHSIRRFFFRELRIVKSVFTSAFNDPVTLFKWMFSFKALDDGIRSQASYFELHPKEKTSRAIIACHGFAATPEIYKDIGPILQSQGFYFRAIRLAGHGTSPAHLAQTSGEHWFSSVVWHYKQIREEYDDIYYLGHSLGATLGLLLSTIYPIKSIVALCAPVNLHISSARYVRQLSAFVKYWPRSRRKKKAIKDAGIYSYTKHPLYAIAGIFEIGKVLRSRNHKLNLPVLYVRAMNDNKNLLDQPDEFRKYFPQTPTTFKDAKNSPHSLLLGPEKDMIHDWIIDWFNT